MTAQTQERRPPAALLVNSQLGILENLYVLCLPALGPFDYVERDCLALLQAAEAFSLNRRIVNEYVFSILTADKAVALRVIEPLNCSLFHDDASSFGFDVAAIRSGCEAAGSAVKQETAAYNVDQSSSFIIPAYPAKPKQFLPDGARPVIQGGIKNQYSQYVTLLEVGAFLLIKAGRGTRMVGK